MENIRENLRNLIYAAIGLISAFLVFKIIFDIGQLGSDSFLSTLVNSITDIFIYPFRGIIVINNESLSNLNVDALITLGVYTVGGYLVVKVLTGFLYDNLYDITQNFVDGFFKIFEFIVGLRILFEIFAVLPSLSSSAFVDSIFNWSEWTQSLLFRIPFGDGYINLSAIVWLIILIVLDIFSERYLAKILGGTVVVASASTSIIKTPQFKFPSLRRQSVDNDEQIQTPQKEIHIDLSQPQKP